MAELVNLEEFIKPWMKTIYESDKPKIKFGDLIPKYHWEKLNYTHYPTEHRNFNSLPDSEKGSNVLFKTSFDNTTDIEQSYNFHVERQTNAVAEISISKGHTYGVEMSAEFKLPGDLFTLGAGFQYEYSLQRSNSQSISETITWGADSNVKVPPRMRAIAELKVEETKADSEFTIRTDVSGELSITLTNPRDNNNFVCSISGEFPNIIKYCQGKNKADLSNIRVEGDRVELYITGKSKFSFGAEQKVKVSYEPL